MFDIALPCMSIITLYVNYCVKKKKKIFGSTQVKEINNTAVKEEKEN